MIRVWVEAARPRTLPAALVPVLAGTAAGGVFAAWRFAGALVVALALQVAVNYANDYFDGVRGVDTPDRVGPRRAVASGLVRPSQMKIAIALALAVAAAAGLALTAAVGPELLLVGAASIAAALAYSGGPRPYASAGLGEVFVFVFFGPVATIGTAYVQSEAISSLSGWISIPVGMMAAAILVVNNLRDVETDAATGKRTLAVRLGPRATRRLFAVLALGAIGGALAIALAFGYGFRTAYLVVPLAGAIPVVARVDRAEGRELVTALGMTALVHLVFGAATAAVLWD
ncbi:MAG TPA: 1,4-dihydroxy-2-naphthoate polyprenyltransferase [Actinomycetota bacterium]|nr:1,4-dihydroxy-2-naphthoate polyprenyltransferase [Actinomycetota bacterium]